MTAGTVVITGGILATVILLLIIAVLCYCRLQVRPLATVTSLLPVHLHPPACRSGQFEYYGAEQCVCFFCSSATIPSNCAGDPQLLRLMGFLITQPENKVYLLNGNKWREPLRFRMYPDGDVVLLTTLE